MSNFTYYIVYSMTTANGGATGRCTIDTVKPLDRLSHINEIEKSILADARAKDASATNLFLTFWTPIMFEPNGGKS